MFDVGISKLLIILAVALIVLGPEKLPTVAGQIGRWLGRARTMARQFRDQLEEEASLVSAKANAKPVTPKAAPSPAASATPDPAPAASVGAVAAATSSTLDSAGIDPYHHQAEARAAQAHAAAEAQAAANATGAGAAAAPLSASAPAPASAAAPAPAYAATPDYASVPGALPAAARTSPPSADERGI